MGFREISRLHCNSDLTPDEMWSLFCSKSSSRTVNWASGWVHCTHMLLSVTTEPGT